MTTPETPGDPHEQPDSDRSSAPPAAGPSTGPASRGGFNWRNRWVLIGGGGAAIVAIVVIVAAVMLTGGGPGGSSSVLALIPDDTGAIVMLDMATIGSRQADFPGDYDDFIDDVQQEIEWKFDTEEIDVELVNDFILLANDGYFDDAMLLLGSFAFDNIRDEWDGRDYEDDSYRGYEIWDGGDYYVLLEDEGAIVASDSEDLVKDVINIVDRGTGSLADDDSGDLARIIAALGSSPVVVAMAGDLGEQCDAAVPGCAGIGVAFAGSDLDREEMTVDLAVLFSSERRAERAADDYDDVADFLEALLDSIAEDADDFSGLPNADSVDIDDISAEGEFVLGTGFIEIESE